MRPALYQAWWCYLARNPMRGSRGVQLLLARLVASSTATDEKPRRAIDEAPWLDVDLWMKEELERLERLPEDLRQAPREEQDAWFEAARARGVRWESG